MKGTILISNEGINGSLSGSEIDLLQSIKLLKTTLNIRKIKIKINNVDFLPFKRLKVRLKKEIVSLRKGNIDVQKYRGISISPNKWNEVINDKNTKVIDVRNEYEIDVGRFKNSISPRTGNFRDFPRLMQSLDITKEDNIAMYCTGGIRCEKASAYLKLNGFKNVVQLDGGIINYLEFIKKEGGKSLWDGECFVFDDRVTIDKSLSKGSYMQCYGCRRPIRNKDVQSKYYKKGICCPYCFHERTEKQKLNSLNRQKQIDNAEKMKKDHPFKKIRSL